MRKKVYYLLAFALLGGCFSGEEVYQPSTILQTRSMELHYNQSDHIDLKKLGIIEPSKIIRKGEVYVILTPESRYRFTLYDANTEELVRLVPAGKETGQGLYYLTLNINGSIVSSFDFGTGRLVEIDLEQYKNPGYQPMFTDLNEGKKPLGALRVDEKLISTGIYPDGRYCCTNANSGTDTYSVEYPVCAERTLDDTVKSVLYASNILGVHPSHGRLVCANMQNGCLDICDIQGDELVRLNEVHLNKPKVYFQKRRGRGMRYPVAYSCDNVHGFCDLTVSEDYIFTLYSGKTYRKHKNDILLGNTILVFDWEGEHVCTYKLKDECLSISYDPATQVLSALVKGKNKARIIHIGFDELMAGIK